MGRRIFSWCLIVQLPLFHRFNVYGCEIAECGTLVRFWGSWDECHVGRIYKKVFFSGFYFSLSVWPIGSQAMEPNGSLLFIHLIAARCL